MPAIHLVHLLLLTALALLLPLLARILAAKIPPLLVVPLLELLTLRILLPAHLVGFPLVFLVQPGIVGSVMGRSEEHTSELQSRSELVCRLLLEKKNGGKGLAVTLAGVRTFWCGWGFCD